MYAEIVAGWPVGIGSLFPSTRLYRFVEWLHTETRPSTPPISTIQEPTAGSVSFHATTWGVSITLEDDLSRCEESSPSGLLIRRDPSGVSLTIITVVSSVPGETSTAVVITSEGYRSRWPSGDRLPLRSSLRIAWPSSVRPPSAERS